MIAAFIKTSRQYGKGQGRLCGYFFIYRNLQERDDNKSTDKKAMLVHGFL